MSPELRGLMETLRRGSTRWLSYTPDRIQAAYALPPGANRATPIALMAPVRPKRGRGTKRKKDEEVLLDRPDETSEAGSSERTRKVHRGRVLRPRSQAQSPGLPERPVSVAIPSGGARKAPDTSASSAGDRALNDEVDSLSRQSRRRVLEEINSVTSGSSNPRLSLPLRASGEGTSRVNPGVLPSSVSKAFSWSFAYDSEIPILENPDKEEIAGHLLTIQQLRGELDTVREAERQCEVDFQELRKKLAAAEAEKVIAQRDLNSMEEKYRREIEGAKAKIVCSEPGSYGKSKKDALIYSDPTDSKGYFYVSLTSIKDLLHCRVKLYTSPVETCNNPTKVNKGLTRVPVSLYGYRYHSDKNLKIFSVGPFYFTGHKAAPTTPKY
ncbi:hypothetical protein Bca52824_082699 [Brassica carinata]|uniref:Uncharacterized protein n=1 Tax=Brassica carinata TaxID=52824 RepID=A0A8X7PL46_BRACI|nr:hypothetical protein Bca52824_082699 [Brassica carinata]